MNWLDEKIDKLWKLENEERKILRELEKRGIVIDSFEKDEITVKITFKNPKKFHK